MGVDRREVLKGMLMTAATGTISQASQLQASSEKAQPALSPMIDTNVSLFQWPFRRLAYDTTPALIVKLKSLGIQQAWAGSFEGLLHRDLAAVNQRLAEECSQSNNFLLPFGTINIALPDWENDVQRCHEVHLMTGVRLYPNYHGYQLDDPDFEKLLRMCGQRNLLVQLAVSMEDKRTQPSMLQVKDVDLAPLPAVMNRVTDVSVQLLNHKLRGASLKPLAAIPRIYFDTARVDGSEGIARLLAAVPAGRVVEGSHSPFFISEAARLKIGETELFNPESRQQLYENARRLAAAHRPTKQTSPPRVLDSAPRHTVSDPSSRLEVWDSYFLPAGFPLVNAIERALPVLDYGNFQKSCLFLDVGVGTANAATEKKIHDHPESILEPLKRWPNRMLGFIQLNANDVNGSLSALDRWLKDGPMLGVYFPGGGPGALACSHPNFEPLVKRIHQLGGLIMQHTWDMTGGKAIPTLSTPTELAELAAKHPEQTFIAAHAGGEWEKGIRAVRGTPNIMVETSGFDPTAGFVDMAVRELGAERIVFGSHLPSRSLGTELGKVFGAQLTDRQRQQILKGNLQKLLAPLMKKKGIA